MHARLGRDRRSRVNPPRGKRRRRCRRRRTIVARIMPDYFSARIQNFQPNAVLCRRLQVIVKDHARRRILSRRLLRWQRRVVVVVGSDAHGFGRLEQMHRRTSHLRCDLAQGRDVIENPERATMCGNDQVTVLHHQIVDRTDRQVKLQRLPVVAIVQREIDSQFGPGK